MTTATEMYQRYLDAETAITGGQTVRFRDAAGNERLLTRANLAEVQQGRREWERKVGAEKQRMAGGASIRYQVPDFRR